MFSSFFGGGEKSPSDTNNIESNIPEAAPIKKPNENNPLLENLERTVFSFNMHNLTEMCFDHVVKKKLQQKDQVFSKK